MSYLNCPQCGLSIRLHAGNLLLENCPRCRGRRGVAVPMYRTERPRPPRLGSPPARDATSKAA